MATTQTARSKKIPSSGTQQKVVVEVHDQAEMPTAEPKTQDKSGNQKGSAAAKSSVLPKLIVEKDNSNNQKASFATQTSIPTKKSQILCSVCFEKAEGTFCDAPSCKACTMFFRRLWPGPTKPCWRDRCIGKDVLNCDACRYSACERAGMHLSPDQKWIAMQKMESDEGHKCPRTVEQCHKIEILEEENAEVKKENCQLKKENREGRDTNMQLVGEIKVLRETHEEGKKDENKKAKGSVDNRGRWHLCNCICKCCTRIRNCLNFSSSGEEKKESGCAVWEWLKENCNCCRKKKK